LRGLISGALFYRGVRRARFPTLPSRLLKRDVKIVTFLFCAQVDITRRFGSVPA
jgi:hypothetical protein